MYILPAWHKVLLVLLAVVVLTLHWFSGDIPPELYLAGLTALAGYVAISLVLAWGRFREKWSCPRCGAAWSGKLLRRKMLGVFEKPVAALMRRGGLGGGVDYKRYAKYKLYHRCTACGHEWAATESRRA